MKLTSLKTLPLQAFPSQQLKVTSRIPRRKALAISTRRRVRWERMESGLPRLRASDQLLEQQLGRRPPNSLCTRLRATSYKMHLATRSRKSLKKTSKIYSVSQLRRFLNHRSSRKLQKTRALKIKTQKITPSKQHRSPSPQPRSNNRIKSLRTTRS